MGYDPLDTRWMERLLDFLIHESQGQQHAIAKLENGIDHGGIFRNNAIVSYASCNSVFGK